MYIFAVYTFQCASLNLPAMMLNILGLRMAGQMSRRKTKPLDGEEQADQIKAVTSTCRRRSFLTLLLIVERLPDHSRPHGGVGGPLLLNRLLQAAVDEP